MHRAANLACDCWHCPVCRRIKASCTCKHLAGKAQEALDSGQAVRAVEVAQEDRERVRDSLRRTAAKRGSPCEYAELQRPSGDYLFIFAVAATLVLPERVRHAKPLAAAEIGRLLSEWAISVRGDGYEKKPDKKRIRPVNLSTGWAFPKEQPQGNWRIVGGCPAQDQATVEKILGELGVRQVFRGDQRQTDAPYVWHIDFRVPPDQRQRVLDALSAADDPRPPTNPFYP